MISPKDVDPGFTRMMSKIRATEGGHDLGRERELLHNRNMAEPLSRPELDAKLETIEARMDGRLARIEDAVTRIASDNAATRSSVASLKTTVVITAVSTAIAIVFGIAAFNSTLLSNMTSSFDSGRETTQLLSETRASVTQTQQETAAALSEMRKIVSDLQEQAKPKPATVSPTTNKPE